MEWVKRNVNSIVAVIVLLLLFALISQGISAPQAVSILLSGVTLAALYFLVASGLSLIFGLMGVLNFAHGSLFMLGAYIGWTFYTNPRLIFNTAPFALAIAAGIVLTGAAANRLTNLPRLAVWAAVLIAAVLAVVAMRGFPLDKLVAMGNTMTGRIIPTAQAQEPLPVMLARIVWAALAGIAAGLALNARRRPDNLRARRALVVAGVWALAALVVLLLRDAGEQIILHTESNLRFFLALAVGALAGGSLGALLEWGLIRPLYARPIYQILLTLGLVFVADQIVRLVWGPAGVFMDMPAWFAGSGANCPSPNLAAWLTDHCDSILVLGRAFPSYRLFIIGAGAIMVVVIALVLRRSRLGMIIRAGVEDSVMVEALGINVRRVFTLVFAIGAALAGLGGVVAAPFLGVYPPIAMEFLLQAVIVVVIGGMGSVPGAAVGALLVGLARAYGDHLVLAGIRLPWMAEAVSGSPAIARASTVLIMAIVLLIKPTGIFGEKE